MRGAREADGRAAWPNHATGGPGLLHSQPGPSGACHTGRHASLGRSVELVARRWRAVVAGGRRWRSSPRPAGAATCTNAFSSAFAQDLAQRYPGIKVTAAVYDTRTGCWHHLHQGLQVTTASVIKAQVLGAVLLQAQDAGRGLTAWERSQIGPMIRYSFNPETSNLYGHVGYEAGMHASDPRFGVTVHDPHGHVRAHAQHRRRPHERGAAAPLRRRRPAAGGPRGGVGVHDRRAPAPGVGHQRRRAGRVDGGAEERLLPVDRASGWRVGSSGFVRQDDADQGYAITVMTEGAIEPAHRASGWSRRSPGGRPPR